MKLTLYLFQPSVQIFENCLKPQTEVRKYKDITNEDIIDTFRVFQMQKEPAVPKWASFLGNYVHQDAYSNMQSVAPAVVILFKIELPDGTKRILAATNGSAYSILDTMLIERKFGLKVTLNSIGPNMIKSLEYKDARARRLLRRESSPNATSIANFGFAFENELIKSVTGKAIDEELGTSISGGDSLKITIPELLIGKLPEIGLVAYNRFLSKDYKQNFDFIDNLEQVFSQYLVAELDMDLVGMLSKPVAGSGLSVEHMNQASYAGSDYIQLTAKGEKDRVDEVDITNLHKFLLENLPEMDVDMLKHEAFIYGYSNEDMPVTPKTSVYKLLNCRVVKDDVLYVLQDGLWYKVLKEFAQDMSKLVGSIKSNEKIPSIDWSAKLPASHLPSTLGDKWLDISEQWLTPKGRGKLFVADAYLPDSNSLVVFKQTRSANSLNFLADRLTTLAELIRDEDPSMMDCLTRFMPELANAAKRDELLSTLNFVYFVGYEQDMVKELTVFDNIALVRAAKSLRRLGFKVSLKSVKLK